MKRLMENQYLKWGLTAFCVIAASELFYLLIFHGTNLISGVGKLFEILTPVIIGLVLAYILNPVMIYVEYHIVKPLLNHVTFKIEKKQKSLSRGISILLTMLLFIAMIYALIAMFVSQIVPSVMNLISNFDVYVVNVTNMINKLLNDNPELGSYVTKMINQYSTDIETWLNETLDIVTTGSQVLKVVSMSVINVIGILWNSIIGFIISIYVLASKEKFAGQAKKLLYALLPQKAANRMIRNFRCAHRTFSGFFSGKVLDSIIIGLLCFMGTTIMGTPYAALVSVIIGITNIIPFVGPALGAIPTTVLILLVDPMNPLKALYFVIFILILQQFDGNVLGPKILGESTGLSSFWVIFAITLFGGAFGMVGMIVGVPIFALIYADMKVLMNDALTKKKLPHITAPYMNVEEINDDGTFREFVPDYKRRYEEKQQEKTQRNRADKSNTK